MPTGRQAILLAEDDPDIADMIAECLTGEGYAVTTTATVTASVAALTAGKFALVMTDAFVTQGFSERQWDNIEQIRRAAGTTPIILCTAHRTQDFPDFAARGFATLLSKPFDLDHLLTLIARLIAQSPSGMTEETPEKESAPRRDSPSCQATLRC